MAGIGYTSTPAGASLTTDINGLAPLGAPGGMDMGWLSAIAQRRADEAADERRRAGEREMLDRKRQAAQDAMQKQQFQMGIRDHDAAIRQAQMDRMQGPERVTHWFKNFGIGKGGDFGGPVEVAPGTFGAYQADIGDRPGQAAAAAQRGLTPGLAGQKLGGVDKLLGESNQEEDEDIRNRRVKAESGGRMGLGQAGIGLGYQHIRGDKDA